MGGSQRVSLRDYSARRIAIIKPSALGDIVNSLPVLIALRTRYPQAHIAWVVNRVYEELLHGHPDLDETLPFDRGVSKHGWWRATQEYVRFFRQFRQQEFDLVIDLQGLLRSGLMTAASAAPRRVGLSTAREGATWFYTDAIAVADFSAIHAVERYWLVAEALGVGHLPKEYRIAIPAEARAWAESLLARYPRPWLVFGVGARWQTKRWPPEHFAVLARRAQQKTGGAIFFVGGREETVQAQATAGRLEGLSADLTGQTTLPQLAALLARADGMVANDTGPLHLAVALGCPVVAPYTCTRVRLNGPYGMEHGAVESRVWCQGSYVKRCARLDCMSELTPERLWPPLEELLTRWQCSSRPA